MLARDDALTFGPADLMVIKRTRGASGHRLLVTGMVWAQRMKCEWLRLKCTASLNQRVPELFSVSKTPFTINTVIRRTGQWGCFFFFLPVHELRDVFSWKQHPSVTVCQKPVPHAWRTVVTFHMAIIIRCLLFVAISGKRSHSGINRACVLLDVNKHTSLKQKVIKGFWQKWIPFFTRCSVWRCESRGTAGLTDWLSFLTYTDVTQLSWVLGGLPTDGCCPLCLRNGSEKI